MLNVIFFSLLGGLFSLLGAMFLFRSQKSADKLSKYATPFAAGVLLAAAFVDLIPEAIHKDGNYDAILLAVLFGVLTFFLLERFLRWFHHHHENESKARSSNSLIIIGDTLHNALDGIAIGAAFTISVPTGIIAALAVALHEIPQEIGDFGILLKNGMRRKKVLIVNALSALATTVAAVLTYSAGSWAENIIPYLLAITGGFFIYIAASDIIPEIHETTKPGIKDIRPWLLVFGALLIMIISPIAHDYIDAHDHEEETSSHHMDHSEDHLDESHNHEQKEDHGHAEDHEEEHNHNH